MKSIVIVDDSPTIRRMVRAALAGIPAGRFIEAASGLEAIEQLTLGPVGLMVLDMFMSRERKPPQSKPEPKATASG